MTVSARQSSDHPVQTLVFDDLYTPLRQWVLVALYSLLMLAIPAHAIELRVLTWEEYINPEVVSAFEEEAGVLVRFTYYEDDDERDYILASTNGQGFDLIIFDAIMTRPYQSRGWLHPVSVKEIPNLVHVHNPLSDAPLPDPAYSVPYAWGSIGILYRRDKLETAPQSWLDLYRPAEALRNRILMINTASTTFRLAMKALGYSINSEEPAAFGEARALLQAQRPYVRAFRNVLMGEDSDLVNGEVWMAMAYNGDANWLIQDHPELEFRYPAEGSMIWLDSIAIMAQSSLKSLAADFINFLHDPDHNVSNTEYIQYATPNQAATRKLAPEFLANPVIYPDLDSAGRFEADRNPPPQLLKKMIGAFMELNP